MTHILFVDDEQQILNSLQRAFRGFQGYTYHFAASPVEALEVLAKQEITVLVSDHKMPQMTGAEFLARVKEKRPDTIRMLLTGQADLEAVQRAVNGGEIFRFFLKPWKDEELRIGVRQAVEYHSLIAENRRLSKLAGEQNQQMAQLNERLEQQVGSRTKQLADALYTARELTEQIADGLYTSTRALFNMLRLARPALGSHSKRVSDYAAQLGKALDFSNDEIMQLEIAALLHDAGKLGLPAFISDKHVSDYRPQELELYRTHPIIGSEFIKGIKHYDRVCTFVAAHHERMDGSGFPNGLKGSQIPREAYIIGVLDEYDHLMNRSVHSVEFNYQLTCQRLSEYADLYYPRRIIQAVLDLAGVIHSSGGTSEEVRVSLSEIVPHMVLVRDVFSTSGHLLLAAGSSLTVQNIARLRAIAKLDPLVGEIAIGKISKYEPKPALV